MNLLQISDDSKYYLFEDKHNLTLSVYALEGTQSRDSYVEFKKKYDVPWKSSKIVTEDIDTGGIQSSKLENHADFSKAIEQKVIKLSIDNQGNVVMIHCLTPEQFKQDNVTLMHVLGSKFVNGQSTPIDFKQTLEFQLQPIEDVDEIIDEQEKSWMNLLKTEIDQQERLPEQYRNPERKE